MSRKNKERPLPNNETSRADNNRMNNVKVCVICQVYFCVLRLHFQRFNFTRTMNHSHAVSPFLLFFLNICDFAIKYTLQNSNVNNCISINGGDNRWTLTPYVPEGNICCLMTSLLIRAIRCVDRDVWREIGARSRNMS